MWTTSLRVIRNRLRFDERCPTALVTKQHRRATGVTNQRNTAGKLNKHLVPFQDLLGNPIGYGFGARNRLTLAPVDPAPGRSISGERTGDHAASLVNDKMRAVPFDGRHGHPVFPPELASCTAHTAATQFW